MGTPFERRRSEMTLKWIYGVNGVRRPKVGEHLVVVRNYDVQWMKPRPI
jgi:hypothetical protein